MRKDANSKLKTPLPGTQAEQDAVSPNSITRQESARSGLKKTPAERSTDHSNLKQPGTESKTSASKVNSRASKNLQSLRVRKVRSKSPPTAEGGKNPAQKIKKFYGTMAPAFTNKKRQNSYYNSSKQGFNYINWDMENELYLFQTQIE